MDKDIQVATKALFYLIAQLDTRFKPLGEWFTELVATIDKWRSSEGSQGVKRAKDILNLYFQKVLGQNPEPLPFVRTTEEGIPLLLLPLHRVVQRKAILDTRFLSLVLTICRVTDLFRSNPTDKEVTKTLDIIQESRLPGTAKEEIDKFSSFVDSFLAHYQDHPITVAFKQRLPMNDDAIYLYRESKGPNGPLTASQHLDLHSLHAAKLSDGRPFLEALTALQQEVCKNTIAGQSFTVDSSFQELVMKTDLKGWSETPGKLSLISEKGAKTRIVCQPDFYSQYFTQPIRRWLNGILKALVPMDVTFCQEDATKRINSWLDQGGYMASFDQSQCTDLFPFDLQLSLLQSRFGSVFSESFKAVTVDRDWKLTMPSGLVKKVRWSVGQPMGMFASWPLMAVTHHFLVQYAALSNSATSGAWPKKPFQRYVICGDDIVIADHRTATKYREICKKLGMKINDSKSHISGKGTNVPPVAEFTRKIFWKGSLLYPIKPNLLLSAIKDARNAVPLLLDLADKSQWAIKLNVASRFIRNYFRKESNVLTFLLTVPREIGGIGYRDSRSLMSVMTDGISAGEIHPYVYYIGKRLRSRWLKQRHRDDAPPHLEKVWNDLPGDVARCHPLYEQYKSRPLASSDVVPSFKETVAIILGGCANNPYMDDQVSTCSLWNEKSKEDRLAVTTAWFQAIRKKRFLKPWLESKTRSDSSPIHCESSADKNSTILKLANELNSASQDEFLRIQYDLIARTILAQRLLLSNK